MLCSCIVFGAGKLGGCLTWLLLPAPEMTTVNTWVLSGFSETTFHTCIFPKLAYAEK